LLTSHLTSKGPVVQVSNQKLDVMKAEASQQQQWLEQQVTKIHQKTGNMQYQKYSDADIMTIFDPQTNMAKLIKSRPRPQNKDASLVSYSNTLPTEVLLQLKAAPDHAEMLLEQYQALFPSSSVEQVEVKNIPYDVTQMIQGYNVIEDSKLLRNTASLLNKQ
jgi:quinol monooxygenase YgiN